MHPSVDSTGRRFTGTREQKAGMKLSGGPFALVQIRWWLGKKHLNMFIDVHSTSPYVRCLKKNIGCLSRGDWKWLKESWNMKRWWRIKAGICFKCLATASPGPYVILDGSILIIYIFFDFVPINCMIVVPYKTYACHLNQPRFHDIDAFGGIPRLSPAGFLNDALPLEIRRVVCLPYFFIFQFADVVVPQKGL